MSLYIPAHRLELKAARSFPSGSLIFAPDGSDRGALAIRCAWAPEPNDQPVAMALLLEPQGDRNAAGALVEVNWREPVRGAAIGAKVEVDLLAAPDGQHYGSRDGLHCHLALGSGGTFISALYNRDVVHRIPLWVATADWSVHNLTHAEQPEVAFSTFRLALSIESNDKPLLISVPPPARTDTDR